MLWDSVSSLNAMENVDIFTLAVNQLACIQVPVPRKKIIRKTKASRITDKGELLVFNTCPLR